MQAQVYEQYSRPDLNLIKNDPILNKVLEEQMQKEGLKLYNRPFNRIALTNVEPQPLGAAAAGLAPLAGMVGAGMLIPSSIGEEQFSPEESKAIEADRRGGFGPSPDEMNSMVNFLMSSTRSQGAPMPMKSGGNEAKKKTPLSTQVKTKSQAIQAKKLTAKPKQQNVYEVSKQNGGELSDQEAFDYGTLADYVLDVLGKKPPKNPMEYEE